jgi:hypothetical protein
LICTCIPVSRPHSQLLYLKHHPKIRFWPNYTSLIDSKNYLEISLNAQYNFSVILYSAKNMVCFPVEHDGENLFSPWSKILDCAAHPCMGPTGLEWTVLYGFTAGFGLLKRNRDIDRSIDLHGTLGCI